MRFVNPVGTLNKQRDGERKLFPTGNKSDVLDIPEFGEVTVSLVDVTNPPVFVKASDLGLRGDELPEELCKRHDKMELLEKVRGMAAVKLKLCGNYARSAWDTPEIPKKAFALVSRQSFKTARQLEPFV